MKSLRNLFWIGLLSIAVAFFGCPQHGPLPSIAAWAVGSVEHHHLDCEDHHHHEEVCECLFCLDFLVQAPFTGSTGALDRTIEAPPASLHPGGCDLASISLLTEASFSRSADPPLHQGMRLPNLSALLI